MSDNALTVYQKILGQVKRAASGGVGVVLDVHETQALSGWLDSYDELLREASASALAENASLKAEVERLREESLKTARKLSDLLLDDFEFKYIDDCVWDRVNKSVKQLLNMAGVQEMCAERHPGDDKAHTSEEGEE